MWVRGLVEELGLCSPSDIVYHDNQSSISLFKNPIHHERTKHFHIKLHFVREVMSKGTLQVEKVPRKENPLDALTKALPAAQFQNCLQVARGGNFSLAR